MVKNLLQLRAEVHRDTPVHADTTNFLNDALEDLATHSDFTRKRRIATTNGTFVIPSDCLFIRKLAFNGEVLAIYPGLETPELGHGDPVFWQMTENNVRLFPTPATGREVELIFCPRPVRLVADTDLPAYTNAEEALIAYAKWRIHTRIEDLSAAAHWRAEYVLQQMRWLTLNERQHKQARRVRTEAFR